MKTLHFQTSKVKGLIVDLPEGILKSQVNFDHSGKPHLIMWKSKLTFRGFPLPGGNWEILGFISKLTDEQKEMIVETLFVTPDGRNVYLDYRYARPTHEIVTFIGASESFSSLIDSIGMVAENPQGANLYDAPNALAWQDAESKVFKNPLILIEKI